MRGKSDTYDNGIVHVHGMLDFRHAPSQSTSTFYYSDGEDSFKVKNCKHIKDFAGKSLYKISTEHRSVVMLGDDIQPTEKQIQKVFPLYGEEYVVEFIMKVV